MDMPKSLAVLIQISIAPSDIYACCSKHWCRAPFIFVEKLVKGANKGAEHRNSYSHTLQVHAFLFNHFQEFLKFLI